MRSPFVASSLLVALALALAGCSSKDSGAPAATDTPVETPLTYDVTQPGPFVCGHRTVMMTYDPPGGLPTRTIPLHLWYPSTSMDGDHPSYHSAFLDTHSYDDVPLATVPWKAGLPVLVHSHGYQGFAGNSARLMCHFASHGWLAVAPEHVGNTISDTPPKLPLAVYVHRPYDLRASLDYVAALGSDDPLGGKTDFSRIAMSGHSFGTYTAWAYGGATLSTDFFQSHCASGDVTDCTDAQLAVLAGDVSDPRAKLVMPLAGAPDSEVGNMNFDTVKVPVLQMSGSLNDVGDGPVFDEVSKVDLTWVDVDGGCHQLFGLGNTSFAPTGVPCDQLPDEEGFSLVNPWALAYARYHVLADRTDEVRGLVEGTVSISPKVHVKHKMP